MQESLLKMCLSYSQISNNVIYQNMKYIKHKHRTVYSPLFKYILFHDLTTNFDLHIKMHLQNTQQVQDTKYTGTRYIIHMYYVEYCQSQQYTESKLLFLAVFIKKIYENGQTSNLMTDIINRTKKGKHERHHKVP